MNIKYVSLLSLLCVAGAHAILPDEIIDVAHSRRSKAHKALLECQRRQDFFGRPCKCIDEKNEFETKDDQYKKVISKPKKFLETQLEQGNEATIFERSKKLRATMAKKALNTIIADEQEPNEQNTGMGVFSRELLNNSPDNTSYILPGDIEVVKQFNRDLYKTIPNAGDHPFIRGY